MGAAFYWVGIRSYALVLRLAALFHPKAKLFIEGRKDLLSKIRYALIGERRPRIWMHCSSLGEFEQGRPVLEQLRKQHPDHAFVLTFFSPSGYEVRKNYEGAEYIFYLPIDSPRNARLFLDAVQPAFCLFVKYDLWYFLLSEMVRRQIPSVLISAIFRKKQSFFKWYGGLQRLMLHAFNHIFVQDAASERLLHQIGIEEVTVAGDTRFDRVVEAVQQQKELPIATEFAQDHKIIVAGSTWPDDERFLEKALKQLPEHWKLILVPHEVHESHISDLEHLFGTDAVKWSAWNGEVGKRVLIVDTVGVLLQLYRFADVAWIGGGFGKAGIHNVLEAAVYRIPCAFGPVYHKFLEAEALINNGGAFEIDRPELFVQLIKEWEIDEEGYHIAADNAGNYVYANSGATVKILNYLDRKNWLSKT